MTPEEYTPVAMRLANDLGYMNDLIHASLGIASEAGEVADTVKKVVAYGRTLDIDHVAEELGDIAWFMTLMMKTTGLTWSEIFTRNIAKLEARYPNGFALENSINRNLDAEKAAMLSV